jgi:signal transduction histidine kinase
MIAEDWLLMLGRDGLVQDVDGGAPASWIARRIDDCADLPEAVRAAARRLVREIGGPLSSTLVRRARVGPGYAGGPSFTLIAVEAIPIRPDTTALGPLLRDALAPLLRQAEEDRVSLRVEVPDEPLAIAVDTDKIAWAVATLVGNALRYVRRGDGAVPGGHVVLRVTPSAPQRMVSLTVHDDGPGIPTSVRPWLLAPNPATGRVAGVALRLVHDIVTAHGGGMVIKSSTEPSERGTSVTLWLPLRA